MLVTLRGMLQLHLMTMKMGDLRLESSAKTTLIYLTLPHIGSCIAAAPLHLVPERRQGFT